MFSLREIEENITYEDNVEEENFKYEIDEFLKLTIKNCDDEQLKVLNSEYDKYIVYGPAGSGKSMLAMRNALTLFNENKSFKIIIYTKALTKYLIGRLKKANLKNISSYILCGEEFKSVDIGSNIDYIIIDEVQDFNISDLEESFKLSKKGYYLFGDDGQQIYPMKTNDVNIVDHLINKNKLKNYKLVNTYRFPRKIALFSEKIKNRSENLALACLKEGENENIPKIIEFKNKDDEIQYIKNIIVNEGWKSVGILVANNDDVNDYYNRLRDLNLICDYKNKEREELDFSNDRPKIITYHSSKGLEFERVFIPKCDIYEEPSKYNYREALYVACTRASKTLIISYIGNNISPYLNNIEDKYYKFEER